MEPPKEDSSKLTFPVVCRRRRAIDTALFLPMRVPLSVQKQQLEQSEREERERAEAGDTSESSLQFEKLAVTCGGNEVGSKSGMDGTKSPRAPTTLDKYKLVRTLSSPAILSSRKGYSTSKAPNVLQPNVIPTNMHKTPRGSMNDLRRPLFNSACKDEDTFFPKKESRANKENSSFPPKARPLLKKPLYRSNSSVGAKPFVPLVKAPLIGTMGRTSGNKLATGVAAVKDRAAAAMKADNVVKKAAVVTAPQMGNVVKKASVMTAPQAAVSSKMLAVKGKMYTSLGLVGKGGSSKVYQVLDCQSNQLRVIKVVDLEGVDQTVAEGYRNEIALLSRLQNSNRVVRLYDYEELDSGQLYLVMERGDTDFASLMKRYSQDGQFTPEMIKFYWSEMLRAVCVIHKAGIIHSDLKPANFLLVEGCLKLIDFGIASAIQSDMTSVLKDVQMGTYNFMSPEAIQVHYAPDCSNRDKSKACIKIGVKSDVWSLGCILYQLVYGQLPFQKLTRQIEKLQAICNPSYAIDFPPVANPHLMDILQSCLRRNPKERLSIQELLSHPYLAASV